MDREKILAQLRERIVSFAAARCAKPHVFDNSAFRRLTNTEIEMQFRVVDDFADLRA